MAADDDRSRRAAGRDVVAEDRDNVSEAQDKTAEARDEDAADRDRRAEAKAQRSFGVDAGAASDRDEAQRDRQAAADDRSHAADDRGHSAKDRVAASSDRVVSERERATASIDELTGAHHRDAGMVELVRDIARAKRTKKPYVLAFIDVDGLKAINDSLGHPAGDELLCRVVDTVRAHLRSYDLVVRFGGDEFLCALADISLASAAERFFHINADLAAHPRASISTGLAELRADDSLDDLIARADTALLATRQDRPAARE